MKRFLALPLAALTAACMTYPPPPAAPYRAFGQEPGWSLIIDSRDITFIPQSGPQVRQPTPPVIGGIAGEIYQTPRIGVNIVHIACTDTMSGQVYRDRVQVDVDGRRYEGCGGETAPPAGIANTSWRVVAVNGRATPATGQYFVNFESDRVGAKFGCNSMGGVYRQQGSTVIVDDLAQTLIGCPEPSATFEREGGAIMGLPMAMSWAAGNRLTLSNTRGRIELQRTF